MAILHWKPALRATARLGGIVFVALAAAVAAQALLEPALADVTDWGSLEHVRLVVANALPVATFGLLLLALTGRAWLSAALSATALVILHTINSLKLLNIGIPLLPADFHFLQGGHGEGALFSQYLSLPVLMLPLLGLLLIVVALWFERRRRAVGPRLRMVLGAMALLVMTTLYFGTAPWKHLYSQRALRFEPWTPTETEARAGLMPTLLMFRWEMAHGVRMPKDRSAAKKLLAEKAQALRDAMQPPPNSTAEHPDIVIVQSESFFDPERMRGMPTGRTIPNFHALAKHGASGQLTVPTFGGGTVRTEFEVLTGLGLKFFPGIEYPYFELMGHTIPSLPRLLEHAGYQALAIHPNAPGFWNRPHALHQLGIDKFIAGDAFKSASKVGLFVSDAAMTDRIVAELHDTGPPQFMLAISMEAHGPYEFRPGLDPKRFAALPVPPGLDEYGEHTLRNYLYHLQDADHELGRLAAVLMQRKRRTLLLFYGDHLPGLHSTFAQTGFVDGRAPRAQTVPWLLLDSANPKPDHDDLHAWQLPVRVLASAGIQPDAYFALLGTLHDAIANMDDGNEQALTLALGEITQLRLANKFDAMATKALQATAAMPMAATHDVDAGKSPQ
ncbi:MAG TPA: LTA synthase family protein [Rudaea sp.]|nr:LTA synthase family protein [Rudaea sp.]